MKEAFEIATAVLASIGVGGAIVWALSSYLGKVWASRILEADRAKYARELQTLRNEFELQLKTYEIRAGAIQSDRNEAIKELHRRLETAFDTTSIAINLALPSDFMDTFIKWRERASDSIHEFHQKLMLSRLLLPHGLFEKLEILRGKLEIELGGAETIYKQRPPNSKTEEVELLQSIDRFTNVHQVDIDHIYEDFRVLLGTSENPKN